MFRRAFLVMLSLSMASANVNPAAAEFEAGEVAKYEFGPEIEMIEPMECETGIRLGDMVKMHFTGWISERSEFGTPNEVLDSTKM
jgi:hypothetical protein